MTRRAVWKEVVIAQSDDTIEVENNHYFPIHSLDQSHVRPSNKQTACPWKGTASYYDIVVGDQVNADAAWYYPEPKPAAARIKGYVAFWKGVQILD